MDRQKCTYPMNEFYDFEDEVPAGSRVSTADDCEVCDCNCDIHYCLIGE